MAGRFTIATPNTEFLFHYRPSVGKNSRVIEIWVSWKTDDLYVYMNERRTDSCIGQFEKGFETFSPHYI